MGGDACPHLDNTTQHGGTDFGTEAMSMSSAQHGENVQKFWSHEHTQSTFSKIKSLMASFVRRHGHPGKKSRRGPTKDAPDKNHFEHGHDILIF